MVNLNTLTSAELAASVLKSMEQFPVLSGRVTIRQAEAIVSQMRLDAAAKAGPITIGVGGTYHNVKGELITIVGGDAINDNRFIGSDGMSYAADGKWTFSDHSEVRTNDLIEEVSPPSGDQQETQKYVPEQQPLTRKDFPKESFYRTITRDEIDLLVDRLRTSANESENGRNFAGTPQSCRQAADLLDLYGNIINRLEINKVGIEEICGSIAARGETIKAVKLHRSIYGGGLVDTRELIIAAAEEYHRRNLVIDNRK
jgi:hypothetical protein